MSVGYEHLDMKEIKRREIKAANCSTVSSDCVSEFAVTLVLTLARRIIAATTAVRAGEWTSWKPMWLLGFEVSEKTVGILGMGRIGMGIAERLKGFKVRQIYYNDVKEVASAKDVKAVFVNFEELCQKSDIICLSCFLSDATRGLFNKAAFKMMKNTAILINVSRGGVVNHDDLCEALRNKEIAMAALDVTDPEPIPFDHPLMKFDNCIITPHVASATVESRHGMSVLTARNMLCFLRGEEPLGMIR